MRLEFCRNKIQSRIIPFHHEAIIWIMFWKNWTTLIHTLLIGKSLLLNFSKFTLLFIRRIVSKICSLLIQHSYSISALSWYKCHRGSWNIPHREYFSSLLSKIPFHKSSTWMYAMKFFETLLWSRLMINNGTLMNYDTARSHNTYNLDYVLNWEKIHIW